MGPVLYDAVTLRHFAVVSRMDILKTCHAHRPEPRWTTSVQKEIATAANKGVHHCIMILQEPWLRRPVSPARADTREIISLQSTLMLPEDHPYPHAHLGEAQSIYFAEKHQGQFATDDNAAYELARLRLRLGIENVVDSVDILREVVALNKITAQEADQVANDIEAAGRHLRRVHRRARGPNYFISSP